MLIGRYDEMVCAKRGWLAGANLGAVDWSGADLRDAKLQGCNLRGANLANADLTKVKVCLIRYPG